MTKCWHKIRCLRNKKLCCLHYKRTNEGYISLKITYKILKAKKKSISNPALLSHTLNTCLNIYGPLTHTIIQAFSKQQQSTILKIVSLNNKIFRWSQILVHNLFSIKPI